MRTVAAGEFKAKCLALIDEVNTTGEPLLITKRGKPVARVLPSQDPPQRESPDAIFGSLRHMGVITGDIISSEFSDERWDSTFNEKWDRFEKGPAE
jgi:prevent-host-death family protein